MRLENDKEFNASFESLWEITEGWEALTLLPVEWRAVCSVLSTDSKRAKYCIKVCGRPEHAKSFKGLQKDQADQQVI